MTRALLAKTIKKYRPKDRLVAKNMIRFRRTKRDQISGETLSALPQWRIKASQQIAISTKVARFLRRALDVADICSCGWTFSTYFGGGIVPELQELT